VVLYSHDTMGIGHMRRNLLIAQTLAAPPVSATVLLIAGACEASAFVMPPDVDCLTVPSLTKSGTGQYRARALSLSLREVIALRAQTIASAVSAFAPDVFIADKEPRGVADELAPTLELLRSRGRTRCVLGLRDVLDDPATIRREWRAAGHETAIRDYYQAVWVYGDPAVYDLAAEYGLAPAVRAKIVFTGYLDACERLRPGDHGDEAVPQTPFTLCTVGGGQDGARLAEAFAAAGLPDGRHGVIIAGPYMPAAARRRLAARAAESHGRLHVHDFVREPCRLMRRAERVVAMGGYNTVTEVLAFERPALIVPRVEPRREQYIRAERLRGLGLLDVLHPDAVSPRAVAEWVRRPAARPHVRGRIDLNGTGRLGGLLRSALAGAGPGRAPEARHAIA
jgi:predicted glycosyltransferase